MNLHLLLPAILLASAVTREISRKLHISPLAGEISVGIVVGPAVMGLTPSVLESPEDYRLFREIAHIGVCALLFEIGLETRWEKSFAIWSRAALAGIGGMFGTFALVAVLTVSWGWNYSAATFLGAVLAVSSVGVAASVIAETRAQEAQIAKIVLVSALFATPSH